MGRVLIVYHSRTGNTEKMADCIRQGIEKEGVEAVSKKAENTDPGEFLDYDGIIIGSPTYYGNAAWEIKKIIDESVKFHGQLEGKIGGAFASSANLGGGNETTVINILEALLIHGMIIAGSPQGAHYGPVSIGAPDADVGTSCIEFGKKYAGLIKKLAS